MKKNAVGFFFYYWFILFLFTGFSAIARQPATVITNRNELTNIAHQIFYLEDTSGIKDFAQVSNSEEADSFQPFNKPFVNFGLSPSAFWMRLELQNRTGEKLLLQIGNTAITDIKVYEEQTGKPISVLHSGSWKKFSERSLQNSDYIFPLAVDNGQSTTIYIRVQHYRGTQFPLTVGTLQAYYHESNNRNLLEGIYYGFMLLMILYNLFIYFSLRDVSYLYYVAYIFFMALLNASINGYAFKYFWPSWPSFNQYEDIISSLVGITGILFASTFLNTKKHTPKYHRFFILTKNFFWGSIAVNIISLLLVLSFFGAAWQTLRRGYRPAKFFLIAWSLLLLSVIVFILKDFDILPYNAVTVNSLQIGSAIEALLLSMALANRINIYKKEKQQAQVEMLRSLEANEKLIREQ
ncbi:MAG: 7TM diverse intracellular signaling domain-containing protein, partial [Bacteroidota bacterium]